MKMQVSSIVTDCLISQVFLQGVQVQTPVLHTLSTAERGHWGGPVRFSAKLVCYDISLCVNVGREWPLMGSHACAHTKVYHTWQLKSSKISATLIFLRPQISCTFLLFQASCNFPHFPQFLAASRNSLQFPAILCGNFLQFPALPFSCSFTYFLAIYCNFRFPATSCKFLQLSIFCNILPFSAISCICLQFPAILDFLQSLAISCNA
jgi:hypothetical protein